MYTSLDQRDEEECKEKFLLAVVARFKAFEKRVPPNSFVDKRPQRASASKAKSSVLSELSGLENVLFNDFMTMSSTQKTCQCSGPLPLCQTLFQ